MYYGLHRCVSAYINMQTASSYDYQGPKELAETTSRSRYIRDSLFGVYRALEVGVEMCRVYRALEVGVEMCRVYIEL